MVEINPCYIFFPWSMLLKFKKVWLLSYTSFSLSLKEQRVGFFYGLLSSTSNSISSSPLTRDYYAILRLEIVVE